MLVDFTYIQVDICHVIGCSEISEQTSAILLLIVERFLVPDRALVEEQSLILRVPVARHIKLLGSVKIIFDQIPGAFMLRVFEITVGARLIAVVVIARLVLAYDRLPSPVEIYRVTTFDIGNQSGSLL